MSPARTRLLHLSDLHVGSHEEPRIEPGLAALIDRVDPELIVASGDLTHRGRPEQHARAADFLKSLGRPIFAVPGNHDIPYTPIARFTRTYEQFERHWETKEPTYRSERVHIVGLNSVRPWLHQAGRIHRPHLKDAARRLAEAGPEIRERLATALRTLWTDAQEIFAPLRMTDGRDASYADWSTGYNPDIWLDRSIKATRDVSFPLLGLDPTY